MYPKPGQSYTYGVRPKRRMTFPRWLGLALCLTLVWIFFSPPTNSQLNQSGGVTLSGALPAGTNIIGKVGIDQTTPGTTNGVQVNAALPAGANIVGKFGIDQTTPGTTNGVQVNAALPAGANAIGTVALNAAIPAGTNVIGTVDDIPKTACGNTVASQPLAAVPTSATAVFTATTCVVVIALNNTNSSPATVTITDNQGTPINDLLTFSIPGNSQIIQPLHGLAFTSGVKWTASGTGVTGGLLGFQ